MTYNDVEPFLTMSISYKATRDQANQILLRLHQTREFRAWDVLDYRVQYGNFDACSPEGIELCEKVAEAYRIAVRRTQMVIEEVLGE